MKRLVFLVVVLVAAITAASAMAAPAPKTTGGIGYTAYSEVQRHLSFNAIQSTKDTCSTFWNIEGVTSITFNYAGTDYIHTASLTQNGASIVGSGGYTGIPTNTWVVNPGSTVVGNALNLTWNYASPDSLVSPVQNVMTMQGTIGASGVISGQWSQTSGEAGTFTATGAATGTTYCGKGSVSYSDAAGIAYFVNVKAVKVVGDTAWFAGPVIDGNAGMGQWLFVKVVDGGEPGKLVDKASGSFTDEVTAINGVIGMQNPADGPFTITSGNLQVH
jgi:hypothetical protein